MNSSSSNSKKDHWIGFDLGGTKMLAKVYDQEFNECGSFKDQTEGHHGKKAGLARMVSVIHEALDDAGVSSDQLAGIGVGVPGPVDPDTGVILEAPNLGWKEVDVRGQFHAEFGCPVMVANDVDAGVYGSWRFGVAKGVRSVVGVFPGTGIGGGAVVDGKIVQGAGISAMEIGHIPMTVDGDGRPLELEMLASRLAIAAEAAKAAYRGVAPNLMKECGTDLSNIKSGALARAIAAGDEEIEAIVKRAAHWLGLGVATAFNFFAPQMVVLGGGLVEAMPELWVKQVSKAAKGALMPCYGKRLNVVAAQLADDATALGAAGWARSEIQDS
jgi:glucokinase